MKLRCPCGFVAELNVCRKTTHTQAEDRIVLYYCGRCALHVATNDLEKVENAEFIQLAEGVTLAESERIRDIDEPANRQRPSSVTVIF